MSGQMYGWIQGACMGLGLGLDAVFYLVLNAHHTIPVLLIVSETALRPFVLSARVGASRYAHSSAVSCMFSS